VLGAALWRHGASERQSAAAASVEPDPSVGLYPVARNERYQRDRPLTDESFATSYNNFYEFGSHKQVSGAAQALALRPWQVALDGLVEQPLTLDVDDLLCRMPLEERLYRHRCVEAWSMAVPWSGFALKALVALVRPLGRAKYLQMTSFEDPETARASARSGIPGPMSRA
jgi:sulfoxide reductase catalytic subunit YedY